MKSIDHFRRAAVAVAVAASGLLAVMPVRAAPADMQATAAPHVHVQPPPRPPAATLVMPGMPEADKVRLDGPHGAAPGFKASHHRLPNGGYRRD
jgi:hypothetical protein